MCFAKKSKPTVSIRYVEYEDGKLLVHIVTPDAQAYICSGENKYLPQQNVVVNQEHVTSYYQSVGARCAFYLIPVREILNKGLRFYNSQGVRCNCVWSGIVSYSAAVLNKQGLYARVLRGKLYIENKVKFITSVLFSPSYSWQDKGRFLKYLLCRKRKNTILFVENGGAADNSFELFKYALKQNKNCYYAASSKILASMPSCDFRGHVVEMNSPDHIGKFMRATRVVTSFTMRHEAIPQNKKFKDIHLQCNAPEWCFVPHGYTGDKYSILLHKCIWDAPSRTFCCNAMERDFFTQVCDFPRASYHGFPRMDKWYDAKFDGDSIFVFFTWRVSLSRIAREAFAKSTYYEHVVNVARLLKKRFADRPVYYVFHHEIVRNRFDEVLKSVFSEIGLKVQYIYLNDYNTVSTFNSAFAKSKYLITDMSSVAYDFAYKKGAVAIYYMPDDFVEGHYKILPVFYDVHLGVICKDQSQLRDALQMEEPTQEMAARRDKFFAYTDGDNCKRVYQALIAE